MRSYINLCLADHLYVRVSAAALWMRKKAELYLFYLEHHDFRGVISIHRECRMHCRIFFFVFTRRSKIGLETPKDLKGRLQSKSASSHSSSTRVEDGLDDTVEHLAKTCQKIVEVDFALFFCCPLSFFRLLVCLMDTPAWDRKALTHTARF